MTRVLVAGDANLDLILRGDVAPRFGQAEQLLDAADLVLGSSAGICAAGLARLGVSTDLCARVGDDLFGAETLRRLEALGVGTAAVGVTPRTATGLSVVLSQPADRGILTLPGAMAELSAEDVRAAVEATDATHVHLASFFLLPRLAAEVPALLAWLGERGVTTSLDSNWDPSETWTGVAACLPVTDVLLPNAAEAVALASVCGLAHGDAVEAAAALSAVGPIVAVKDGAAGGFAAVAGDIVRAPGLAVTVVDTTGAGDSFDAGFLTAWTEGRSVAEALRWGVAAGSLSTRGAGGTAAQADRAELLEALS